ncbi:3-deoxy-7-phosphoheptulonate synthase [Micromonospora sp. NPDC002296]|uniref:3-deoxy-7-phosphoheptulonate synthase n=1 Tax=Micromonospora sp. NPDC002296 TaxID=3154271 RepID=UPI003325A89E
MSPSATEADLRRVVRRAGVGGPEPVVVRWPGRPPVLVVPAPAVLVGEVDDLPGVHRVIVSTVPYHLAGRDFRAESTVVDVGGHLIGAGQLTVIAGPCAVESRQQLAAVATGVAATGAGMLRGGAFKPRTSPYSFQGLGVEGLRLLAEQRRITGLPVVTEALRPEDVDVVAEYADMVQIGTRSMQNFPLLQAVGRCGRPVLLKRGMSATVEEWLLAAEYVLAAGNPQVVLCERGIRTFETTSRFTLDLSVVPVLKRRTHLPVIVDPSHAAGHAYVVAPMAMAAAAAGADGVMIDVHADPERARCDAGQALTPPDFARLTADLDRLLAATRTGLALA